MSTASASHYSQHALASLRRRPYTPPLPPSPSQLTRPRSINAVPLSPPPQFSMIDFLRAQSSPTMQARPLTVVDALRHNHPYAALPTALPSPPPEPSPVLKSYPSPARALYTPLSPQSPQASLTPTTRTLTLAPAPKPAPKPKARAKRDTLATFFRWSEPTPELRPLLLAPMARPAEPNPTRPRIKEDDAARAAAAESRVVPIGGARAARLRAQRQWESRLARGRPALSLDIDSELSYERERIETPLESVFVARERERDSWLKR
ncbi:hypothetical protein CC85DRAFT_301158 [Cutaneotrichosporon oleaginosum]|uniref:Uncharacterized protein n=1 Tax=Cutaneotrichosporon oleaginosum TaxID=879819 RepID=A0A0J0XRQ2_9TREE|nr:uncharacterized protein CC85DRAFT_301158 [Cutaneotrichosporon oleaginosum]KLT43762.1 hypothetical protein CC85DRAFT_301158 [Cutaneotrichosporon oleaginosum]TXT05179.1 hypothetical protein COLE_06499 [Cutaneotrichosporon oleaginosum]